MVHSLKDCLLGLSLACAVYSGASALTAARAETVPVRHREGTVHGFLALRTKEGRLLAVGDLVETIQGNRVTSRLVYRFKDGSVDDEATVYSQGGGGFHLITDHHIQRGTSFPQPMDMLIDVPHGQLTVRSGGKDGKAEVKSEPMKFPPDLANGLLLEIAKNILPETAETKVPMLVATPKPRMVTLAITPRGEDTFSVASSSRKAMRYEIRIELGGVAGVVAPLVGKQPPNIEVWIAQGPAPAFVKEEGPMFEGGPIWTVELTSPVWAGGPRPGH